MASFSDDDAPIIGIDLGTTYSCVAAFDPETQKVKILPNTVGSSLLPHGSPSLLRAVSWANQRSPQASMNSANTIYDVKRFIGRSLDDVVTREESKRVPYNIVDGGDGRPQIEVDWRGSKHRMSPEEISSMVLMEMKKAAEAALGKKVSKAVITVPAHFNDQQRQATKDAGRIAGLEVARIINEPTAAALAYGLHSAGADGAAANDKANVLIFDLGGGTFDVSILSMEGGVFAVKATGGDTHLGGEDFDNAIVDWCLKEVESKVSKSAAKAVKANNKALQRLRRAVEAAKRNLSTSESSDIELEQLIDGSDFSTTLSRATFEKICDPLSSVASTQSSRSSLMLAPLSRQ